MTVFRGRLPEIEQVRIMRILQAFDDLVQLGFIKNRLGEIKNLGMQIRVESTLLLSK